MFSNFGFGKDSVISLSSELGLDFRWVWSGSGVESVLVIGVCNVIRQVVIFKVIHKIGG